MSKRNIAYVKPKEPSFLTKLKEEAGYKEGPNIDTKRQTGRDSDSDEEDLNEEQPTVVVLKPGDLTAAQAEEVQKNLDKEAEEEPADLNKPIVFKSRKDKTDKSVSEDSKKRVHPEKNEKKTKKAKSTLLSFDNEEEDE